MLTVGENIMAKIWVVIDIGCLECGESTEILYAGKKPPDTDKFILGKYFAPRPHSVELFEVTLCG